MATTQVTPAGVETRKPQKSLFDLDSMSTVVLYKPYEFHPVADVKSAQERIGHDTAKLIEIINRGLQSFEDDRIKADQSIPWMTEDEEGNLAEFQGTPADDKAVNGLVLNMAKASFGYLQAKGADAKRAAKQAALDFIKSQPVLIAGMKAQLESAEAGE